MSDVINGVLRAEDLKIDTYCAGPSHGFDTSRAKMVRITHNPTGISVERGSERSQYANRCAAQAELARLVAFSTAQPQASAAQSAHHCSNCLGVQPESCMFAQSAPAGEREAFETQWTYRSRDDEGNPGAKPLRSLLDSERYRGSAVNGSWVWFQHGAAWQRTQSAWVPEWWQEELNLIRSVLEGYTPSIVRNDALRAVKKLAAAPAQPAAQDQGEVQGLSAWIACCDDQLPSEDQQVLCWCDDGGMTFFEVASQHNGFFTDCFHELLPVTHWMPLPAAPAIAASTGQEVKHDA